MPTTTPNNLWPVPTSTDYVKDGATAIESLGDAIDASVGNGLKAWVAFTPTLSGITVGTPFVSQFAFCQIGKTVHVRGYFVFGSGTACTGSIGLVPPVTAAMDNTIVGNCMFVDAGTAAFNGVVRLPNTTLLNLVPLNTAGTYSTMVVTSSTIPFTWVAGDSFAFTATYQGV
jgi:hypothetical protein